jgi:general secretion pathway protein F
MAVFSYSGVKNGKKIKGIIETNSIREALTKLKEEGIIVTKINEAIKQKKGKIYQDKEKRKNGLKGLTKLSLNLELDLNISPFSRISRQDIAVFSRQVASLLKAGISLTDSLDTIAKQTRKLPLRQVIISLSEGIKSGKSFSQVLSEHRNIFPEIYIGMVRSGETSGELDKVMEDLGEYLEKQIALRSKITSAMVYPVFIVAVMGIVMWVLLSFVVPKIAQLLEDVGKSLPIYTRLLITFSKIFSATAPYFLLALAGLFILRKKILSVPKIRYNFDLLRLKIPIYSKIHILGETYRIFSTLATLTRAGVPLVKAIETAEEISTNVHIKKVLRESKEYAIEGRNISERFAESEIFPPMISNMISVGERSGELEKMFWNISQITSSELETFLSGVTSLIEPILILSIGGMIFLIMLSVIVPILEINRSIM